MKRNSDFRYDLMLGEAAESDVANLLGMAKIEVKRDFKCYSTGNLFIEYRYKGRPSGISTTEAEYYCIVYQEDRYLFIKTNKLKEVCRRYIGTERDRVGGDSNLSQGILVPIVELLKP